MVASKENKIYTITEEEKESFIASGYDIYNNDGELIAYGNGKSVSFLDFTKLQEECNKLKEKLKKYEETGKGAKK